MNNLAVVEESILEKYTAEQLALIKSQVAKEATDNELKLFLYICNKRGLDPLARQIYCIHRNGKKVQDERGRWVPGPKQMTVQTSIDGFRSIAERTGTYAPGDEKWDVDSDGRMFATVSAQKFVHGTWVKFSATAYYEEYAQMFEGKPQGLWEKMPRVLTAKCAEAKCLRKGWPEQLDGIYIDDEMPAENESRLDAIPQEVPRVIDVTTQAALPVATPHDDAVAVLLAPLPPVAKPAPEPLPETFTPQMSIPPRILIAVKPVQHLAGMLICDMKQAELECVIEHMDRAHEAWQHMPNVEAKTLRLLQEIAACAQMVLDNGLTMPTPGA